MLKHNYLLYNKNAFKRQIKSEIVIFIVGWAIGLVSSGAILLFTHQPEFSAGMGIIIALPIIVFGHYRLYQREIIIAKSNGLRTAQDMIEKSNIRSAELRKLIIREFFKTFYITFLLDNRLARCKRIRQEAKTKGKLEFVQAADDLIAEIEAEKRTTIENRQSIVLIWREFNKLIKQNNSEALLDNLLDELNNEVIQEMQQRERKLQRMYDALKSSIL